MVVAVEGKGNGGGEEAKEAGGIVGATCPIKPNHHACPCAQNQKSRSRK